MPKSIPSPTWPGLPDPQLLDAPALMTDRCLDRLRNENSLIWPMSAMFRALSRALSCSDRGSDFMFLRTRVNSVRRNRSSASFRPIEPLSPNSLPVSSRVNAGTGVVSLPGVSFRATISWRLLKTRCSLKPKNQPILPRWARPANAGQCDDCRKGGGIDVVEPGLGPQVTVQEEHQRHEDAFLQGDEVLVARHAGKVAAQQRLGEAVIEALEMFET